MSKLAIIDIDGVICDSSARFVKAEEAKATYLANQDMEDAAKNHGLDYIRKEADKIYWQTAFAPDLVWLDTLVDGVPEALEQIDNHADYDYYFLTSRPETMRAETIKWLFHHLAYDSDSSLIMKPMSQQFIKTVTWKSGVVELLVRMLGVENLLYVDGEQVHCDMVESLDLPCDTIICGSLQEAIVSIGEE